MNYKLLLADMWPKLTAVCILLILLPWKVTNGLVHPDPHRRVMRWRHDVLQTISCGPITTACWILSLRVRNDWVHSVIVIMRSIMTLYCIEGGIYKGFIHGRCFNANAFCMLCMRDPAIQWMFIKYTDTIKLLKAMKYAFKHTHIVRVRCISHRIGILFNLALIWLCNGEFAWCSYHTAIM